MAEIYKIEARKSEDPLPPTRIPVQARGEALKQGELPVEVIEAIREDLRHSADNRSYRRF